MSGGTQGVRETVTHSMDGSMGGVQRSGIQNREGSRGGSEGRHKSRDGLLEWSQGLGMQSSGRSMEGA